MGFLATFVGRLFASKASRALLPPGTTAPEFTAQDHLGRTVRLADLRGRRVVLWFFPKASTPGCTRQGCAFRDRAPDYAKRDVHVLAASFDTAADNRRFADAHGFPFPILCDVDRRIGLAYRAAARVDDAYPRRITYVIGPDGVIESAIETEDPGAQAEELLRALDPNRRT